MKPRYQRSDIIAQCETFNLSPTFSFNLDNRASSFRPLESRPAKNHRYFETSYELMAVLQVIRIFDRWIFVDTKMTKCGLRISSLVLTFKKLTRRHEEQLRLIKINLQTHITKSMTVHGSISRVRSFGLNI